MCVHLYLYMKHDCDQTVHLLYDLLFVAELIMEISDTVKCSSSVRYLVTIYFITLDDIL